MEFRYKTRKGKLIQFRYDNEFLEEEHPRGKDGRFINKDTIDTKQANTILEKIKNEIIMEEFLHRLPKGTNIAIGSTTVRKTSDGWNDDSELGLAKRLLKSKGKIVKMGKWELPPIPPIEQNKTFTGTETRRGHNPLEKDELVEWFMREGHSDRKTAQTMVGLLMDYTDSFFEEVKAFERTGVGDKESWIKLNHAIDMLPKVDGKLWRGTGLSPKDVETLKVGKKVKLNGLASFSNSLDIASEFASYQNVGATPVVFELNDGLHRGTNLTLYSQMLTDEGETLMHSQAEFEIESWEEIPYKIQGRTEKILTVYLKENYE